MNKDMVDHTHFDANSSATTTEDSEFSVEMTFLTPFEITAFCSILEDCIDQIIILGSIDSNACTKQVQLKIDSLKKRAEKYAKNDPIYNSLNGELFCHTISKMKFLKLHTDRILLEELLVQTKNELLDGCTFKKLIEFLKHFNESKDEEQDLITNESINKMYSSTLRTTVKKKVEESRNELQRVNEMIAKCKDEIETMLFDSALKIRYVENWENARIEQGFMICDHNEQELIHTINKYKNEIEKEIRINAEIELYIAENQKDIEEGINSWMQRYERELEERQTEIQVLKEKREEQQKRYEAMLIVFEEHAFAIQEFLEYKERKRLQEEEYAKRVAGTITIQAWWRGTMVRKKLGPYNPNPVHIKATKPVKGKGKKKK